MDPRLLDYYNRELGHVHEMAIEFAKQYPKIARRLGLDGLEVKDPYIERLIDGFAYMAARVRLKVDAEFPRFTQHLLEMVYPHYLAPTPSMGIIEFIPDLKSGSLKEGYALPRRDTVLRTLMMQGDQTACEYRTAHDVTLWPLRIAEARYLDGPAGLAASDIPVPAAARTAIQLQIELCAEMPFEKLPLDALVLYVRGGDQVAATIYEQLVGHSFCVAARGGSKGRAWSQIIDGCRILPRGFDEGENLLPDCPRTFHGYRVLQEYFAYPERFMFVELNGLRPAVRRCGDGRHLELFILATKAAPLLAKTLDAQRFGLFCAPAVNLFPKRADPILLSEQVNEYHVVADRSRPLDFEVYAVTSVSGYGTGSKAHPERRFQPFYTCTHEDDDAAAGAYYTVHRESRTQAPRSSGGGRRSSYVGTEVFVALVDEAEAPYSSDLRQLSVATLCTNRDLPVPISTGDRLSIDFVAPVVTLESGAPVESIRFASGPTSPRPPVADREIAWRLISHLSLNYLSIADTDGGSGAAALRELLGLYVPADEPALLKQIEGLVGVSSKPTWRRLPISGPAAFGRGLEVTVTVEESAFQGSGAFLLGAVLEQFFARYVSINAFTQTVLQSTKRGEVMRWPARIGRRQVI